MPYYGQPKLVKHDDQYILQCAYNDKDIAKLAGFRWERRKDKKFWATNSLEIAKKLEKYADDEVLSEIHRSEQILETAISQSRAITSNSLIPAPTGMDYLPFQKAGIDYMRTKNNTLLGDDMGLGKTIQAIGIINLDESIKRVLVVCPASLKINWRKELEVWLIRPMTIEIAKTQKIVKKETVKIPFPTSDIVIINYDILARFKDELRAIKWDLLVCDECHYLRNAGIKRTQQVIGKHPPYHPKEWELEPIPAKRKLFLTGTPIVNRPIELWSLISTLDPVYWNDYEEFCQRYCSAHKGKWGWNVKGAQNLGELQNRLRQTVLLRRTKSEVLTDLPPKLRQIVELTQNGARQAVEDENAAFKRHEAAIHELRVTVELSKTSQFKGDYAEAVGRLREGVGLAFGDLATARKNTAIAKVPYVLEHLDNVSGKVVIFAHHKEVIRQLKEKLKDKAVVLSGATSMGQRNKAVEAFQNDPNVQYFIGSIQAAGVGLTLTASSHVVFAELDWVPGNVCQAEDRCHRIGQQDSVLVQHLVFNESIDAKMAKTIVNKQTIIDAALDDPEFDDPEFQIPVIPEDEPPGTSTLTWKVIAKEAEAIHPKTIIAIHSALRYLSNICDGALQADGRGFNAYDASIGSSLAEAKTLTPKQAVLGRKLLRKYSKQLGTTITESIND